MECNPHFCFLFLLPINILIDAEWLDCIVGAATKRFQVWCGLFSLKQSPASAVCTICIWPLESCDDCYQAMVTGQLRQCWGTLPRVEAHNMLSSIHHKYCNYTTSHEWLTSPTAIALPGHCIIPLPLLGEFYLDFIEEQTFANVDCVGAIYLMTVVTSCCWCPPVVADFRTGRMDNASFTLTSFVSTLQQCSSSTGYNQVHIIWATAKMLK